MADNIQELIEAAQQTNQLTLILKIHEDGANAPLGVDLQWLDKILFVAGVAEFVSEYATYIFLGQPFTAYQPQVLDEFASRFEARAGLGRSWIDMYEEDGEFWEREFRSQLLKRNGGLTSVGSSEQLRVELQSAWRENPSARQIVARGSAGAILILSAVLGASQLMKENGAQQCRHQYLDYSERQMQAILKASKFEGIFSAEHGKALERIQLSVDAGIAACGATMAEPTLEIDPAEPKITFKIGRGESQK